MDGVSFEISFKEDNVSLTSLFCYQLECVIISNSLWGIIKHEVFPFEFIVLNLNFNCFLHFFEELTYPKCICYFLFTLYLVSLPYDLLMITFHNRSKAFSIYGAERQTYGLPCFVTYPMWYVTKQFEGNFCFAKQRDYGLLLLIPTPNPSSITYRYLKWIFLGINCKFVWFNLIIIIFSATKYLNLYIDTNILFSCKIFQILS